MTYEEFRDKIKNHLDTSDEGATWGELKERLELPYETPCYSWISQLESDIGLVRKKKKGNALLWELKK